MGFSSHARIIAALFAALLNAPIRRGGVVSRVVVACGWRVVAAAKQQQQQQLLRTQEARSAMRGG